MAPFFKRREKTTIAELEDYYANKKQGRTAMSWFMAFLSLLITVLILVGLFFVSRWVYRSLTDSDKKETAVVLSDGKGAETVDGLVSYDSDEDGDRGVRFEDGTSNDDEDLVYGDLKVTSGNNDSTVSADDSADGVVTDEAATSDRNENYYASENDGDSEDGDPESSVVAGVQTPPELPDTGAGEDMFALIVTTVAAGYIISRKRQLSQR